MDAQKLEINDDEVYVLTPSPKYGEDTYQSTLIMNKEIFLECYKKWVEPILNEETKTTK